MCKEEFVNKAALQDHQVKAGHLVQWDCDMCDKKFKSKSIAQTHKARIHSTLMPFKCGKCEKRFNDQGSCRRHEANDSVHIRMENAKLNPSLICNVCGKEFDRNRRWCLDQHLLTHLANKKFSCDKCGQFYRQKAYLQTHMRGCQKMKIENTEEEPEVSKPGGKAHTCRICAVGFRSFRSYMVHGENVHNAVSAEHFLSIQEIISTSN